MHIGVDLGRTKIELVVLGDTGSELRRERIQTPANYEKCVSALAGLVSSALSQFGMDCSIGVGTPGTLAKRTGLMINAGPFDDRPLDQHLEVAIGHPITLGNDANCFALSEAKDGAGADAAIVFGVIIGTGVGGGLVVDGKGLTGANAIAGEWGHNPLPWPKDDERPGSPCFCGKSGCIETFLSGPSLEAQYAERSGQRLTVPAIAASEEPDANATLSLWEHRLARALASVINIVDPNVIVLGGGLSNISRIYSNVPKLWTEFVSSDQMETRLVAAKYGDASGVRGAAWLGQQNASNKARQQGQATRPGNKD